MNYENAYDFYTEQIETILEKRATIRKSYLEILDKKDLADAENIFGDFGTGSETERNFVTKAVDARYKELLQKYYEFFTIGNQDFLDCFYNTSASLSANKITDDLIEFDKNLADLFEKRIFHFNQLPIIDDRSCQKWLREVDEDELAKSLVKTTPEVAKKISVNVAPKVWKRLQKETNDYIKQNISDTEVFKIQARLAAIISRLENSGDIVIFRGDDNKLI